MFSLDLNKPKFHWKRFQKSLSSQTLLWQQLSGSRLTASCFTIENKGANPPLIIIIKLIQTRPKNSPKRIFIRIPPHIAGMVVVVMGVIKGLLPLRELLKSGFKFRATSASSRFFTPLLALTLLISKRSHHQQDKGYKNILSRCPPLIWYQDC